MCACVEGRWGGWAELNQLQFITDFSRRRADQGDEDELSGTESVHTGLSATSPPLVCGGGSGGVGIGGRLFKVAIRRALLETRSHGGGRDGGGGSFAQRIVLGFPFVLESFFPPSPSAAFIRPGSRVRVEKKSVLRRAELHYRFSPPHIPSPPAGAETLRRASKHAARARSSRF